MKKRTRWQAIEVEPATAELAEGNAAAKAARKPRALRSELSNVCPYCHAVNDAAAERCRHCQRRLSRTAVGKTGEGEQSKSRAALRADDETESTPV